MSFIFRRFFSTATASMDSAAHKKVQQLIDENAVVVFSKSYCPYCKNTKRILDGLKANYKSYELNEENDGSELQAALYDISGQRTVPNIYIGKTHIGGNSDLESVVKNGKDGKSLKELLEAAGAFAQ
ncbi:thioredoxin-like protein [Rhypophila decipiens]|uniref:Thioredoxin-like protein n=1 Tax=Rhypophila decipiens TaxID=261697 RepID=A0AAN6XZX6_9PEZI|nr:thioredoxin-like protein [Rhypophila decipiens]